MIDLHQLEEKEAETFVVREYLLCFAAVVVCVKMTENLQKKFNPDGILD